MSKKVAVLGTGAVGVALANGLKSIGYDVVMGSRKVKKVDAWSGPVKEFADALDNTDLVVLAVKGAIAEELVGELEEELTGKTVIDTTNPISAEGPVNGVLNYFTDMNESLMERLVKAAPHTNFVKAFNSVGAALMVKPDFGGDKPTMFICGNGDVQKQVVTEILNKFGWEATDMGQAEAARPIEALCMLWCIPAILGTSYAHALKFLKK